MKTLLVHRLPERSQQLAATAKDLLRSGPDTVRMLADDLDGSPTGPTRLVFTGQYNAGKSTLIQALTGREDIRIDSNVATTEATEYRWGAVVLTDTPGVQSGHREHDEVAEAALRQSDLVVFVVTVDLFDDAGVRHLDRVAHELGKRRSMVVVINKIGTLDADPRLRRTAVLDALGPGMEVPIVLTDAKDHLDAAETSDPDDAADLLESGNIAELERALNSLIARAGQEGRLRRPFDEIIAVCAQALELLTDDPADAVARNVINRERRLVTGSRRRLERAFDGRMLEFKRSMADLGEELADALDRLDGLGDSERDSQVDSAEQRFREEAGALTQTLVSQLRHDVEREATLGAQEMAELAGSPQVELLVSDGLADRMAVQPGTSHIDPQRNRPSAFADTLRNVGQGAGDLSAWWGKGQKISEFAGSNGHKLVYDLGKFLGKDFKPWEAVRYAKGVGQAAQIVNKAMPYVAVGVDVLVAVQADRAELAFLRQQQSRRRSIAARVRRSATEVEGEVRARMDSAVADFYGQALKGIEEQQTALDAVLGGRADLHEALAAVAREAAMELALLEGAASTESPGRIDAVQVLGHVDEVGRDHL
ncbi:hypothetical protein GCM10025782_20470 [Pedococcus ginsenosidimutans]|uniref:G domain-containing protein n=1 Tax=Pedococcus ginsenosidimutans TaxID=490570 RepID=A0ABP8Y7H9_9MICO